MEYLIALVSAFHVAFVQSQVCNPYTPLGMENRALPDSSITASSSLPNAYAYYGRKGANSGYGAWCPANHVDMSTYEWIQVEFVQLVNVTNLLTQGRFKDGEGTQYVPKFRIEYQKAQNDTVWTRFTSSVLEQNQTFPANSDSRSDSYTTLSIALLRIRVVPQAVTPTPVCLRMELFGCPLEGVARYSIPQGQIRDGISFEDKTYDGIMNAQRRLEGGVGQLTDTLLGDNLYGADYRYSWVGWRRDVLVGPVVMIFEMEKVRNISSITIHSNNQFSKQIRVFRRAMIYTSIGGVNYQDSPVEEYDHLIDLAIEVARPVTITFSQPRVARFLKVILEFEDSWIVISEVSIESLIVNGSFPVESMPMALVTTPPTSTRLPLTTLISTTTSRPKLVATNMADSKDLHTIPIYDLSVSTEPSKATENKEGPLTMNGTIGIIVGVCVGVILLLICAIVTIVCWRQRRKQPPTPTRQQFNTADVPSEYLKKYNNVPMSDSDRGDSSVTEYDSPWSRPLPHVPSQRITGERSATMHSSGYQSDGPQYACIPIDPIGYSQDQTCYERSRPLPHPGLTLPLSYTSESPVSHGSNNRAYHCTMPTTLHSAPCVHIKAPHACAYETTPLPASTSPYDASNYRSAPTAVLPNIQGASGSSVYGTHGSPLVPATGVSLDLPVIQKNNLRFMEKLGAGQYGEVHLCQLTDLSATDQGVAQSVLVAVKMLQKGANESARNDFYQEIRIMSRLRHENVVQVLGLCSEGAQLSVVTEYMPHGDLHQFLQRHTPEPREASLVDITKRYLSRGCLIHIGSQIASGMRYLEQLNVTHRDLATRNCLVGDNYLVKISDFGMSRNLYSQQYYRVEGRVVLPIRWMAWESVLLGKFTTKSDVWSFGVTLWEIFTFAREQPFSHLNDDQVIGNCMNYYSGNHHNIEQLQTPPSCPKEVSDLMRACWNSSEASRPSFAEIHLFLQRKNLGYSPADEAPLKSRLTSC